MFDQDTAWENQTPCSARLFSGYRGEKIMKKLMLAAALALLLVLALPMLAGAEIISSGKCGTDATWTLDDKGVMVVSGTGVMGGSKSGNYWRAVEKAVIEEGVTGIGNNAFRGCDRMTSVVIPDSVTVIGNYAFYGCTNLPAVALPAGVTSIGGYAFTWCEKITKISIPAGVTSIDEYAFCACSGLTSVSIPDSVTVIEEGAFKSCGGLTGITLPSGVTDIGMEAFSGCSRLKDITVPSGVTYIAYGTFSGCGSLTRVTLPAGLTEIGMDAFSGCKSLTSVTIPDGVTYIGSEAFNGCDSLESLIIPEGVTDIGENAFSGATLYVTRDSCAHQYALENGIPYVIHKEPEIPQPGTATTVEGKVREIVAEVIQPGMSDYQKALALHDYLNAHADYDYTFRNYGADGVLLKGTGVCESFTAAYALLLDAVGISNWKETGYDHIWNVALLDGSWCHIDVTWDENTDHWFFAVTDYALEGLGNHERYSGKSVCNDYTVSYAYKNGRLRAFVEEWQRKIIEKAAKQEYDFSIEGAYNRGSSGDAEGIHARMAYQMFCDTGVVVNGITVKPETQIVFDRNHYSYQLHVRIDPKAFSSPSETVSGDVNGDTIVDGRDLLRLARYLAGQGVTIDEKAADMNSDGQVDGRDVLRLAKLLAGV